MFFHVLITFELRSRTLEVWSGYRSVSLVKQSSAAHPWPDVAWFIVMIRHSWSHCPEEVTELQEQYPLLFQFHSTTGNLGSRHLVVLLVAEKKSKKKF